jgi:hypothetical protein
MLRAVVLLCSCLAVVLGAYLCAKGAALSGGIQSLVGGTVVLAGTLFERWRYKNRNATTPGNWQATGERFVDPETGREVEVLYDPDTGERRYRKIG